VHHLAPPLLARRNDKGELVKQPWGPWMRVAFKWLARFKGLRGAGRATRDRRAHFIQYRCDGKLKRSDA